MLISKNKSKQKNISTELYNKLQRKKNNEKNSLMRKFFETITCCTSLCSTTDEFCDIESQRQTINIINKKQSSLSLSSSSNLQFSSPIHHSYDSDSCKKMNKMKIQSSDSDSDICQESKLIDKKNSVDDDNISHISTSTGTTRIIRTSIFEDALTWSSDSEDMSICSLQSSSEEEYIEIKQK